MDSPKVLAAKKVMARYFPDELNTSTATVDTDYGTPGTPDLDQRPTHLDDSFDMNQTGTAGAEEAEQMIAELHEEQRLEQVERNRNASPPDERFGGPQLPMVDTSNQVAMLMHMAAEIAIMQGFPDCITAKETVYNSLNAIYGSEVTPQGHMARLDSNKIEASADYKTLADPLRRKIRNRTNHLDSSTGIDILERENLSAELKNWKESFSILKNAHDTLKALIQNQRDIHAKSLKNTKQQQRRADVRIEQAKKASKLQKPSSSTATSSTTKRKATETATTSKSKKKSRQSTTSEELEQALAEAEAAPKVRCPFPSVNFPAGCPYVTDAGVLWSLEEINIYRGTFLGQPFESIQAALDHWAKQNEEKAKERAERKQLRRTAKAQRRSKTGDQTDDGAGGS